MLGHILLAMAITTTDQTVNVAKGVKLDVNNFAGDVNVKVWDRDAVRVEVLHSDREVVDIKPGEQTLSVRSRSVRGGPPRSLDYTITMPKWMAISVSGTYADVLMDGVGADVTVETTRGDINVTGGSGVVTLKSIQGDVTLQKAKGRIEVRAVNEGMRLSDISGDLSAETTNGSIILDRIDSGNVDLYTVNGNISYDGPIKDKGVYRLTTHNGMIAVAVPERVNATLMVRTYNGSFRSTFPSSRTTRIAEALHADARQRQRPPRARVVRRHDCAPPARRTASRGRARKAAPARPGTCRCRRRSRRDVDVDVNEAIAAAQASFLRHCRGAGIHPRSDRGAEASIPEAIAEAMASLDAMPHLHPMPFPTPFAMPTRTATPPHAAPTPRVWRHAAAA
jgi:hypothetical protein